MKYTLLYLALLYAHAASGQSLQRATFSSGGNNDARLTVTLGESVAFFADAAPAGSLGIGAQPGDDEVVSTKDQNPLTGVRLLPNPTEGLLGIVVDAPHQPGLRCQLYSLQGQQLREQSLVPGQNVLDLCDLPAASYLLLVQNATQAGSFKIIKL